MLPPPPESSRPSRLADRLAAARRARFVGRQSERELFRDALLAKELPFAVLYIHGPGGVGKTTLLREYQRIAIESGRPTVYLDARNVEPSPTGFGLAVRQAMGSSGSPVSPALDWPENGVLLIDTVETLASLNGWLRESFLPELPDRSLVLLAGRAPPVEWQVDPEWASLTRVATLRNLRPEESQTYLTIREIPEARHAEVVAFTHGHPLALALVAEVLAQGGKRAVFLPEHEPEVVRVLLDRFVRHVPSPHHRWALETCAHARVTTEELLAAALELDDSHDIFEWLRGLSFIEQGPDGLFPHDVVREVLDADLRWRNPERYRELHRRVRRPMVRRLREARGRERQRAAFDILYLHRNNPIMARANDWESLGTTYAEPALPGDIPAMLAMVRQHEGDASARIAAHWAARQPQAFTAFRSGGGELVGFAAHLSLHHATPEDLEADPAVRAAWAFTGAHGPVRPGEGVIHHRFWMGRETYQAVSPAQNLMAATCLLHWVTAPQLAWSFLTVVDPDFWHPIFTHLRLHRSPEAEFTVDGRHYAVYTHDWRAEPALSWLELMGEREITNDVQAQSLEPAPREPLTVLSEAEFTAAVRQALRDFTRPDRLATNPLVSSRLVTQAAGHDMASTALQNLLQEAVATLAHNPKDRKLHRALWHTYLEPAPTQEAAAELLDLPFSTYRHHLAGGIDQVASWLWQRYLDSVR